MKNVIGDKRYLDAADAWIARHTVGFAHDTKDGAIAGGSGVLVRCGSIGGILTCAHVLGDILAHARRNPNGNIGIVANGASDSRLQRIHMKLSDFKALAQIIKRGGTATEQEREFGPDLGFVKIPENTMASLEAIGSSLSLDQQKALRGPTPQPGVNQVLYFAAGNCAELVTAAEHGTLNIVAAFTTAMVTGNPTAEAAHDGYDRFRFEVDPMQDGPHSFEGMSGGGIWILGVKCDADGSMTVLERKLAGIAYYQTDAEGPAGRRSILLHGPGSLYDKLLPEIEALATP